MECLDDTYPIDMEEGVRDRNDDKKEKMGEGKEAKCLNDTSPDEMGEGD